MKTIITKLSLIAIFSCCFWGINFAQTFCLQLTEVSNDGTDYVVRLEMQGDATFNLGSSNLQFSFNDAALGTPALASNSLGAAYFAPTVTVPNPGQASFNIELGFPNTGVAIDAAPGYFELGTITFPITDPASIGGLAWSYNGTTTETVVYIEDEATQIFATSPACLLGIEAVVEVPANDLCADATAIACGGSATGSTLEATTDAAIVGCATAVNTAPGVWYSIVGNGDVTTVDLTGSLYDTKLGVYSGTCAALVCIETNDDGGAGLTSLITFTADAGVTYYIYVTGFSASSGDYTMNVTCAPVLAGCTDAAGCNYNDAANSDDGSCIFPAGCDTCSGETDGTGTVVDNPEVGTVCDDLNPDTSNDVIGANCICAGEFGAPSNDLCADATPIACGGSATGSTAEATTDAALVGCATAVNTAPGVWYSIVGNGDVTTVDLTGSLYDTKLGVYSGTCAALVCIETNDDGGAGLTSLVTFTADASVTYYIYVTGFSASTGVYTMNVTCAPALAGCTNSFACNYNDAANSDDGSCVFATGCDTCSGETDGTGTVVDNPEIGDVCDDLDAGTENDMYTSCTVCEGTPIGQVNGCTDLAACNYDAAANFDDGSCAFPGDACDDLDPATANDVYLADCSCVGSPTPDNDLCSGATAIGCGETSTGSTAAANIEASLLGCTSTVNTAPGVWYSIVGTGLEMSANTNGSAFDTKMGVYSGTCAALVCIETNDDGGDGLQSLVTWIGDVGVTYYIYVTGFGSNAGDYVLNTACLTNAMGCTDAAACNFNNAAGVDDGSCVFATGCDTCSGEQDGTGTVVDNPEVGTVCDDGNPDSLNDVIGADCVCAGELPGSIDACGDYTSSPNAAIDAANLIISDVITVSGTGLTLSDLTVAVRIEHTYVSDMIITLTSPNGTVVNLIGDCFGGTSTEGMNVLFDDEGAAFTCSANYIGGLIPTDPLSSVDGESFDGDWTLTVEDGFPTLDDGTFVSWCLLPNTDVSSCPTDLDIDGDTDGADFSIFLGNYGLACPPGPCPTDFDSSGTTDGVDFSTFLGNYGLLCP